MLLIVKNITIISIFYFCKSFNISEHLFAMMLLYFLALRNLLHLLEISYNLLKMSHTIYKNPKTIKIIKQVIQNIKK